MAEFPEHQETLSQRLNVTVFADAQALEHQLKLATFPPSLVGEKAIEGRAFTVLADEPVAMGSYDAAPQPLQYFLAGTAF